jgi:ABC-type nitrate/sulfonate/bicarbonate transport system substrate-binding protein
MAKNKTLTTGILVAIILLGIAGGGGWYFWSDKKQTQTGPLLQLTLAAEQSLLPTTVWVAENQGYFQEQGLDVKIQNFDSGRNALETMLSGKNIDIATVAQTPVVFNSDHPGEYSIIATMANSIDDVKIVARTDSGIRSALELSGKRIGVTLRSTGHYFLEGFLAHFDLSLDDVSVTDVNAATLQVELLEGRLDAITTWEPHIYKTRKLMGEENITLLISPTPFRKDFYFAASREFSEKNAESQIKFLRAIVKAEKFIAENPAKARVIAAERLGIDQEIVDEIWEKFTFSTTLDQSTLVALEDEMRWAIKRGYMTGPVPNYLDFIDVGPLEKVKPEGVSIIR